MLEPVHRKSLGESVSQRLRHDIIQGRFTPGERLTEDKLSAQYAVSRVPVREALRVLETEGFVVIAPYKGTTVAPLTVQDARDLFEVRVALETLASRRAAERITARGAALISELLARGREAVAEDRLHVLPDLNTALHLALVEASDNDQLVLLMRQISNKVEWIYATGVLTRARASWDEHEGVVAAVLAGDAESAAALMGRHIRTAETAFTELRSRTPD